MFLLSPVLLHLFFFPGTGDARDGDAFSQAKLQVSSYRDSVTRNNTQMSHETLFQVTHNLRRYVRNTTNICSAFSMCCAQLID